MTKICKYCGVELSPDMEKCPLCNNLPGKEEPVKDKRKTDSFRLMKHTRTLWEAFGVISLVTIAFTILINLIIDNSTTWSLYVAGGIMTAWLYYTIYHFARHYVLIWAPAGLAVTLGNLLLIDALSGEISWFLSLSLPISSAIFILLASFILMVNHAKYQGFNVLGFALIHVVVFCIACDMFISLHHNVRPLLSWSLFVTVSAIPVAIILLFLHYRLKRRDDLKSFFHL